MAQVVIRKIDDDAMARLKARARRKGVSLEQELRTILIETASRAVPGVRWARPKVVRTPRSVGPIV